MSQNRKLFLFIALPLVLILLGIVGYFLFANKDPRSTNDNQSPQGSTNTSSFVSQYGSTCDKNADPKFTNSPLALEKMGGIEPLGKMADGHVTPIDHVYVAPIDQKAADNTYDVVMPADGRVVEVGRMPAQYIGDRSDVTLAPDDFRMVVSFNCRYFSIFIHLHKLGDKVAAAVGDLPAGQGKQINLPLKAGELLAHLGGNPFDWTMVDTEKTLAGFITPSLYLGESWKIHTISPFDVYTGELKNQLEAKSLRTAAPLGGKIDYDKAGALVGNWFKPGTNGYAGASQDRYWDGHLAIAPDHLDPTATVYSSGNWDGKAAQFSVKGTFKPEEITAANNIVKIEVVTRSYSLASGAPFTGGVYQKGMKVNTTGAASGTVLLQVLPGEKLKVEQFPNQAAEQVSGFTAAATTYER